MLHGVNLQVNDGMGRLSALAMGTFPLISLVLDFHRWGFPVGKTAEGHPMICHDFWLLAGAAGASRMKESMFAYEWIPQLPDGPT